MIFIEDFITSLQIRRYVSLRLFNGDSGGGGGNPPYKPPVGKSSIKGSPGLLTSTGGLVGANFQLLMPVFDSTFQKIYLALIDPTDFDTDEDCFYTFRQEDVMINRKVSVHALFITYREIDRATFTIGVQVYIAESDSFKVSSRQVTIAPQSGRKVPFPSGTLRSKKIAIQTIDGERPQPFISRKANSGAIAITRLMMVGNATEKDLM